MKPTSDSYPRKAKITAGLAGVGLLLTAAQIFIILLWGQPACINTGCKIVEEAVSLSPLYFNLIGLIYFISLFASSILNMLSGRASSAVAMLLLSGLAVEGVLVGYQTFVLQTFCSYCLTIFGILVVINLLQGSRHAASAAGCFLGPFVLMSLLTADVSSKNVNLDMGTYAVKRCNKPEKELYLIFSKDCPHCQKVLKTLEGCTRCQFHFNPIKKIDSLILPDLEHMKNYDPRINVATLRILGINQIPVLIDKTNDGLLFIKGDRAIIEYVERSCFPSSALPEPSLEELLGGQGEEGVCSMESESPCESP